MIDLHTASTLQARAIRAGARHPGSYRIDNPSLIAAATAPSRRVRSRRRGGSNSERNVIMPQSQSSSRAKTRMYRVGYNFECGAAVLVEAESPEAAAALVEAELDDTHEELPGSDRLHFESSIVAVEEAPRGARPQKPTVPPALLLDAHQARALRELVRYVYDQEASDFSACEADERDNHIYSEIRILALACGHVGAEELAALLP